MTRGPVSEQALEWALAIAERRGNVYFFERGRESPCDFQVVNDHEDVFVSVKRTRSLHRPVAMLGAEYREQVRKLRAVPGNPAVTRELWVCSRAGRWRFFRVGETGLAEHRSDGYPAMIPGRGRLP